MKTKLKGEITVSDANVNQQARGWANKWTKEEDLILSNYYSSKRIEEIMELIPNRTKGAIFSRAHKLGLKHKTYNKDYFNVIDSPVKAYWVGFLYADGYVSSKNNCWGVELKGGDYHHLQTFNEDLESNTTIQTRTRDFTGKTTKNGSVFSGKVHSCSIEYNNATMHKALIDKGVLPSKSRNIIFPSNSQIPSIFLKDFIRGVFDGDGSYTLNNDGRVNVSLVCANRDFLLALQNVLLENKIQMQIHYTERDNIWVLRTGSKTQVVNFINYVYSDGCRCLERKRNKSMEILKYCLPQQ